MYQFDGENCVFKNDCIKYGTPDCCDPCWRQREYDWLLNNSNLPNEFKTDIKLIPSKQDYEVFEYLDYIRENIVDFVQQGNNLIIRGATGCGKSCWSTKLLRRYLMEVSIGNGYVERALFVNLIWFVSELRHNMDEKSVKFNDLRKLMHTVDFLVLDDLGATNINSDYIHDEIYSIINDRIDNGLTTVYTTNLSNDELSQNLGARLSGRIIGKSEIVTIKSKLDLRRPDSEFSFKNFKQGRNLDGTQQ